ncbi:MAG: DUF1538 domain-containing protein [Bacillota bacterium]|jgi:hypothetical protein
MSLAALFAGLPGAALEVATALTPLLLLIPLVAWHYRPPKNVMADILRGLALTFVGLTLLLHGVHVGFLSTGQAMGQQLGSVSIRWLPVVIGSILGFVAAVAEPAVHVLCAQVERASSGSIKQNILLYTVAASVALFVGLGMARIVYGVPFTWLVFGGYASVLVILQFADPTFSSIAFDAGGVSTGPMVSTFILSLSIGLASVTAGRDPVTDGFGMVALVALAPILAVMILGQVYRSGKKG